MVTSQPSSVGARASVLIIDPSEESRDVLRTALEHRGLEVWDTARADEGAELARERHVDLIVLDLDAAKSTGRDHLRRIARRAHTPVVLLGAIKRHGDASPEEPVIAKPYHYGPLISKIEAMLEKCLMTND